MKDTLFESFLPAKAAIIIFIALFILYYIEHNTESRTILSKVEKEVVTTEPIKVRSTYDAIRKCKELNAFIPSFKDLEQLNKNGKLEIDKKYVWYDIMYDLNRYQPTSKIELLNISAYHYADKNSLDKMVATITSKTLYDPNYGGVADFITDYSNISYTICMKIKEKK
jgi:hypothetical protein